MITTIEKTTGNRKKSKKRKTLKIKTSLVRPGCEST